MITDPRVFEDAYLPRELMHREGAVEELSERVYYGHDLTPIGKRSRRNKLAKLQEYDLI